MAPALPAPAPTRFARAGAVAMLVAIPLSVAWAALGRTLYALPDDYVGSQPAFLLYASAVGAAVVATVYLFAERYTREPLAVGLIGSGFALALGIPLWIGATHLVFPGLPGAAAVNVGTHLVVGGVSSIVVLLASHEIG